MRVALVNTNRIQPPIGPIGLDYIAEALHHAGHEPNLLDLCWEEDPLAAIARFFERAEYGLIGVTLRNTDDCAFASKQSFVEGFHEFVAAIRHCTDAPIVVGGVGFSTMPEQVLAGSQATCGIWGEGEFALPEIASRIERGEDWRDVPNLVWTDHRNPPADHPLDELPSMTRRWIDNRRYFRVGGQAGFETKRGCPGACIYCADPVAKGRRTRVRPPAAVADEIACLLEQGIDHLHTCDGEFNLPADHALAVCEEITRRGLGERLRWYAYCSPAPFSRELALAMHQAGCVGINFGADSGDAAMLRRLGRAFSPEDIANATHWSRDAGMAVMLDLLIGAPGESRESIVRTIELMQQVRANRIGISLGVRVYPGTELARQVGLDEPFYLEPAVAPFASELLDALIGKDRRFLFFDPNKPNQNYNYNANERLSQAILDGHRGAYWDILRRLG